MRRHPLPLKLAEPKSAASNGVVIATEKRSQPLVDDSMIEKVALICPNIGIVYSGMGPDFRILVGKARKQAQAYWKIYAEYPPTRVMVQEIATVMQEATQSGSVLPSACVMLRCLTRTQRCEAVRCIALSGRVGRGSGIDALPG